MTTAREQALVTGASAGIGRALARLLARNGADLWLVARRGERLRELAGELEGSGASVRVIACDLADPKAPARIEEWVQAEGGHVDLLVNNAGFGLVGPFAELPLDRQLAMVRVNVTALVELTGRFLPAMRERGHGAVLNVGSTAGFQPGPRMAVYYATKAFVLSFSEALSEELRGTGVTATCLAPGPTETEFVDVAGLEGSRLFAMATMSAEDVATRGLRALRKGRSLVVAGWKNRAGAFAVRLAPRSWVRKIVKRLQ